MRKRNFLDPMFDVLDNPVGAFIFVVVMVGAVVVSIMCSEARMEKWQAEHPEERALSGSRLFE